MKTKTLTQLAMLCALTALLGLIPNIGIIQVGPVSITILHIPVIIASVLFDVTGGAITGLVFGLTSMFVAATRGATPIDLLFVNPLISVLPRFLFGITCGLLCKVIKEEKAWQYGLIGFVSTLLHTALVYVCLYLFGREAIQGVLDLGQGFVKYILGAFTLNAILEATLAAIVSIALMSALKHVRERQ